MQGGKTYGDEYLAELDYIESVENLKEGYESEVRDQSDFEDDDDDSKDINFYIFACIKITATN